MNMKSLFTAFVSVDHIRIICIEYAGEYYEKGINPPKEKRWRLYILPQCRVNLTRPIEYKESHIFAIFVHVLTTCMLGLKM